MNSLATAHDQIETSRPLLEQPAPRRGFLRSLLITALGGLAAAAARAKEAVETRRWSASGEVLHQRVSLGEPPFEPLDTMMHFRRADENNGKAITHEVLSLTHEEKGKSSYPWTLYAHLDTHHETGDACVVCARLHKYGPGWSTGLHSEVFAHNRAVSLGANIEMFNDYRGGDPTQVYGVNIQSILSSPVPGDVGLNIHGAGGWKKAIQIDSKGEVAIDVKGDYPTGLDLHGKDLVLDRGGSLILDRAARIRIRCQDGVIEFLKGDRCFARFKTDGAQREL
jgi:hypothetical protein